MKLLGYISVDESEESLNCFGREMLPVLREEYLGKTFLCYDDNGVYMLKGIGELPHISCYNTVSANLVSGNTMDVGLDILGNRVDFKKFANSLRSFHASKSLDDVFEEEPLQRAS